MPVYSDERELSTNIDNYELIAEIAYESGKKDAVNILENEVKRQQEQHSTTEAAVLRKCINMIKGVKE